MNYTVREVLSFVEENDVKFIRLAFCDIFGTQKNISINSDELENAFSSGVPIEVSPIPGFMNIEKTDLLLFPDSNTLKLLPWRPSHGKVARLFCDIRYPNGEPFEGDGRFILKSAELRAKDMGFTCRIGTECEFYLFQNDEKGIATNRPADFGGYMDIAPLDKCENVRREVCLTLEEMDIKPVSSYHEKGPGQNEINFKFGSALDVADNLITFKSVVKTISERNGYTASFMPKPILDNSGSGLHIHISLIKDNENIFKEMDKTKDNHAKHFVYGIMSKVKEMTAFLNPLTNSYRRFGLCEAPKDINWSYENLSPLIRILAENDFQRMELRSTDPSCNPYIAFALLINAGLDGIEQGEKADNSINFNDLELSKDCVKKFEELPINLLKAIKLAEKSEFLLSYLPKKLLDKYIYLKKKEYAIYDKSENKNKAEMELYFLYN